MRCECYRVGGPFIAEDPDCPIHGYEAQAREKEERAYRESEEEKQNELLARIIALEEKIDAMPQCAQPAQSVPDGVAEALQRLIENGAVLGPASSEDALLVARYRQRLLACAPSVPEGWKLVPIEPTKEMRDAWDSAPICEDDDAEFRRAYSEMIAAATEAKARKITPGAQPAPSVPEGFSREDLESVADGLDGYEKTVNVGNVTGEGDDHLESTTAYAARFIRAMLAAAPEAKP